MIHRRERLRLGIYNDVVHFWNLPVPYQNFTLVVPNYSVSLTYFLGTEAVKILWLHSLRPDLIHVLVV